MDKKLTIKQEKFVQKYLETGNATEAYRHAYSTVNMKTESVTREAYSLLQNPNISSIIQIEQEKAREMHNITRESIAKELEDARIAGMTEKQISAAISASLGKAKLYGLMIDKQEIKVSPLLSILQDIDGRSTGLPTD